MDDPIDTRVKIPKETNILLRRFVMEHDKKNKEKAIVYILENFLNEMYKLKK